MTCCLFWEKHGRANKERFFQICLGEESLWSMRSAKVFLERSKIGILFTISLTCYFPIMLLHFNKNWREKFVKRYRKDINSICTMFSEKHNKQTWRAKVCCKMQNVLLSDIRFSSFDTILLAMLFAMDWTRQVKSTGKSAVYVYVCERADGSSPVATERTSTVLSLMMGLKMCLVSAVPARFLLWHLRIRRSSCFCNSTRMSSRSKVYSSDTHTKS